MKRVKLLITLAALGSMIANSPIIAKAEDIEKKSDIIVNIESTKESYLKTENIGLNLNFINKSVEYNLKDVNIIGTNVGDTYKIEGNNKVCLNVGESKTQTVTLKYIKANEVNPPSTGDEESLMVVGVIAIGSALCVALARKNKKGLVATIVIGGILATGVVGSGLTAYAEEADTNQETVVVTKNVIVDGQILTIELTVGYQKNGPVKIIDQIENLEELSKRRELLMRSYLGGEVSEEDYQAKLAEMYAKQDELDEKKELADLPRLEDGSLDLYNIDKSKLYYESSLNAYAEELTKWYEQGKIDKDIYDGTVSGVNNALANLAEKKTLKEEQDKLRIDSSLEALKEKIKQEEIEAAQKAEEERLKQEEIKARGELYNLEFEDFLDLYYNVKYNGDTSYTDEQMKTELIYRWKEGRYMPSLKTEDEVYTDMESYLRNRYLEENPYAECINNKYNIELAQPDQNILNKIDRVATQRFMRAISHQGLGYGMHSIAVSTDTSYIRTNYMRNLDVAIYNYAYTGIKDERAIGLYGVSDNERCRIDDLVCQEFLISKDGFPGEDPTNDAGWSFDFVNIISPQCIEGAMFKECYLIDNGNNTYTVRFYGYR